MRRIRRILCLLLALCALAAVPLGTAAAGYTYTVRLYAGSRGTIGGEQVVVYSGLHYGDRLTFRIEDVELEPDSKYYVRGFRESGRDNDTVGAPSFVVTKDQDYVVAYGVRGELVAYTLRFLDAATGAELLPSLTLYGNVGDKPVAAFRYVEGYAPRWYNVTGTLSQNAAENVLDFLYDRLTEAQPGTQPGGETAEPTEPGGTGETETADAGEWTEHGTGRPGGDDGQSIEEIHDYDPPLVGPGEQDAPRSDARLTTWIGVILAALMLLLLFLLWRLRRRKKDESNEQ